jgi:hypothetical protein
MGCTVTPATCRTCDKPLPTCLGDAGDEYFCACPENDPYEQLGRAERDAVREHYLRRAPIKPINLQVAQAVGFAIVTGEFHRTLAERRAREAS